MLIEHDTIYLDASGETTDALLIRGGAIAAVGPAAREGRRGDERVVELDADCLLPALTDAHCHLWGLGRRLGSIELSEADAWEDVLTQLKTVDLDELPAGWVLGRRWDEHGWPDERPDWRADLDAAFPNVPVCLHRVDNHAVAVNSAALERAGLLDSTPTSIEGGRIARDDEGRPTGLLVDEAMDPVLDAIPAPGVAEDREMFLRAAEQYLEYGVTSVHIARAELDRIEMVQKLHEIGELPVRTYMFADGEADRLESFLAKGPRRDPAAECACRGVKFFADGALGSGGALTLEPYADGSRGLEVTPSEELERRIPRLLEAGWQVAVHAIGDRAARHVLDAYESADPEARRRMRPRLEHAQMLTAEDCRRLGELSTVASIQPIHLRSDAVWAADALDADQLDRLFPWRRMESVTTLAGGSDFPIEDPNPWHGIATAVSRRAADGGEFRTEQSLSTSEALAAYTRGAAYASHWEHRLGALHPGCAADVLAVDRNPFESSPSSIWETKADGLWRAGERVY